MMFHLSNHYQIQFTLTYIETISKWSMIPPAILINPLQIVSLERFLINDPITIQGQESVKFVGPFE